MQPSTLFLIGLAGLVLLAASLLIEDLVGELLGLFGFRRSPPKYSVPRSGKWPALRRKFLTLHPHCAVCGSSEEVEPHHVVPVHVDPAKELDAENLIPLCNKHGCHLAFGHCFDWRAWNRYVREDAAIHAQHTRQRSYE